MEGFELHRPASLQDALAALKGADDGRALAGGQSLLAAMKLGLSAPSDLVDLAKVEDLRGIRVEGGRLIIGAMTTHAAVAASPEARGAIPGLAELAEWIGDRAVRNMGTIGGSIANADPAACYPSAVVALSATIRTDRRELSGDDFFKGLYETALEPGELITAVEFPIPKKAAYQKFRQPASRFPLVGVFVALTDAGARVGVTGAGACAFRATSVEQALDAEWSQASAERASVPADDLNSDLHGSAEYRAHLIPVLAGRAVAHADQLGAPH